MKREGEMMESLAVQEHGGTVVRSGGCIHAAGEFLIRYLSIVGLGFWMGGFTFYAGVVIHVGHRIFDSHREVGILTQAVTVWLNRSGVIVLLILLANHLRFMRSASRRLRNVQFLTLLLMAAIQIALFVIHPRLDQMLDGPRHAIVNRSAFRSLHLLYMNLSTIQWTAALTHLAVVLLSWRRSDIGPTWDLRQTE
jgi:hypothetical protein